jgi:hypothetical protein
LPFGDPAVAHSVFIAKSAAFGCLKCGENMSSGKVYGLWGCIPMTMYPLVNIAEEYGPFIDDFPINTSTYKGFSSSLC